MTWPIETAQGLLPDQYPIGGGYYQLLAALLVESESREAIMEYLVTRRWIESAKGVWLDEVGAIVGMPRGYEETVDNIFTYKDHEADPDDISLGYNVAYYDSLTGSFLGTPWGEVTYARWIQAKAAATFKGATYDSIHDFIYTALEIDVDVLYLTPRCVWIDPPAPLTFAQKNLIEVWAPRPAGVRLEFL